MFIKQLSVFIENREGRLAEVLSVLKDSGVNMLSLSLADTSEYGLLRLIVSDPATAKAALNEKGFSCMLSDVLGVQLDHKVGKLQELVDVICKAEVNIEYMYAMTTAKENAAIILKASNGEKAVKALEEQGAKLYTQKEIEEL